MRKKHVRGEWSCDHNRLSLPLRLTRKQCTESPPCHADRTCRRRFAHLTDTAGRLFRQDSARLLRSERRPSLMCRNCPNRTGVSPRSRRSHRWPNLPNRHSEIRRSHHSPIRWNRRSRTRWSHCLSCPWSCRRRIRGQPLLMRRCMSSCCLHAHTLAGARPKAPASALRVASPTRSVRRMSYEHQKNECADSFFGG